MRTLFVWSILLLLPLFAAQPKIIEIEIDSAISPASSMHLEAAMKRAAILDAELVLIRLDTPGGLSTSMREMIQTITNSTIPVVTYVAPKGSRAASAGTYLLYASHVAAMAPGTNLGAATPVNMMPTSKLSDGNGTATTLERKAINDAMAYIKSLAELNDRNVSWAEQAVKEGASLSAKDALRYGVIDLIAENTQELLERLDGRVVKISGKAITLTTREAQVIPFEGDWKGRLLTIITDPNIAYILILISIYGIFFELINPGGLFPGVIGVISGLLAMYALNMIPFDYAGLALIFVGIAFMVAEVFVTGLGVLGIGGVIAFAVGSLLLFDAKTLGSGVSIPLVIAFSLVSFGFFVFVLQYLWRMRSVKVVSGMEEMVGADADVIEWSADRHRVHCHGEIWNAESDSTMKVGQRVRVSALKGLVLHVIPIKE